MTKNHLLKSAFVGLIALLSASSAFPQKRAAKVAAKPNTIIFAVLDDGKTLEPIGEMVKGKLTATASGEDDGNTLTSFSNNYYKPKTAYKLIFGGAENGSVIVNSIYPKSDCGKNLAQATTESAKAKLKGFVMGLATNMTTDRTILPVRRLPSAAERAEIESLVRAEFAKQKVSTKAVKDLHYYNLTALDVDNDGKAELIGSYWVESSAKERNLLFFITDQTSSGKYQFGFSEYEKITPDNMMSGDLKDLDNGIRNELLLDALDYDGDKTAEIFTISRSFEGNHFQVYQRSSGKWTRAFENYNYHCGY